MSRIHDALKKAQQERAIAQAPDLTLLPQEPAATVPAREDSALAARPETAAVSQETLSAQPAWEKAAPSAPADAAVHREEPVAARVAASESVRAVRASFVASAVAAAAPPPANFLRFEELRKQCAHPKWRINPDLNVFLNPEANGRGAEQFRTLRSKLYQLRASQTLRTILITSAVPQEGKTWVTSNLAQAIARQADRRVLIIDADLRISRLHVPLGAPLTPGLSDYLQGKTDEMSVIQTGEEGNLCFIAGGSEVKNPTELLSNGRMQTLLGRIAPMFDWVILDSPPCLPVADASLLAGICDGVLLVLRAGTTPSEAAQKASEGLHGRNVIGVVLNGLEENSRSYYHSYYYGGNGTSNGSNGFKDPSKKEAAAEPAM